MTCMAMYGSGAMTGMENTHQFVLQTRKGLYQGCAEFIGAVVGIFLLADAAQPFAIATHQMSDTSCSGFALFVRQPDETASYGSCPSGKVTIQVDRLKVEGNKTEGLPFISFRVKNI
jgi:hypothetical protein